MISTARLYVMLGQFEHESRVAARSGRMDDYPQLCADTLTALRELLELRDASVRLTAHEKQQLSRMPRDCERCGRFHRPDGECIDTGEP